MRRCSGRARRTVTGRSGRADAGRTGHDGALDDARGHRGEGDDGGGPALQHREVGAGPADAEHQGQQHEGEAVRDLLGLGRDDQAARALAEVVLELGAVAHSEVAARVRAEALDGPLADGSRLSGAQVRLDPGLAQALACTEGELSRGAGAHSQQRRDLGRLHLLDLGVPEHLLPARGEAAEGLRGEAAVERIVRGLVGRGGVGDGVELVDRGLAACATPAGRGVADAGEQVGAEGSGRAAALLDGLIDLGERLLDEIVRVERARHRPRHRDARCIVPSPQLGVGACVSRPGAQHEVGVAPRRFGRGIAR